MNKYDCKVILCGPAVGKTYLASHDSHFVDIDGMRAKYKYGLTGLSIEEMEKGKLNRGNVVNKDYQEYTIKLLEETIKSGKIALISYQEKVLNYVIDNNIDYCLVYADIDSRGEYISRMLKRGNSDKFVEDMTNIDAWNDFYQKNDTDEKPKYKIKLNKNQYLFDIKDLFY